MKIFITDSKLQILFEIIQIITYFKKEKLDNQNWTIIAFQLRLFTNV